MSHSLKQFSGLGSGRSVHRVLSGFDLLHLREQFHLVHVVAHVCVVLRAQALDHLLGKVAHVAAVLVPNREDALVLRALHLLVRNRLAQVLDLRVQLLEVLAGVWAD